jgi:hypothetical protein
MATLITPEKRREVWAKLHEMLTLAKRHKAHEPGVARSCARHVRRCWQHTIFSRLDQAKVEFDLAWMDVLRLNAMELGALASKAEITKLRAYFAGSRGGKKKAERQADAINALHVKIQKRAKAMKGGYSKTEALDVLEREFPGYSRRQLSNIVSSVFPPRPRRASSSE